MLVNLRGKGLNIPMDITDTIWCYQTRYCVHNLKNYNQNTLISGTTPQLSVMSVNVT